MLDAIAVVSFVLLFALGMSYVHACSHLKGTCS